MSRRTTHQRGAVIIEGVLSLILLLIVALGFAHVFYERLVFLEHAAIVTQLQLGPQERSMTFDVDAGTFLPLSNSTSPSMQEFMDTIGNHFLAIREDDSVLSMVMMAVDIDPDTGLAIGTINTNNPQVFVYPSDDTSECTNSFFHWRLAAFGEAYVERLEAYQDPTTNSQPPIGTKLFEIALSNQTYKGYIDFSPVVFLGLCKPNVNIFLDGVIAKVYALHPRRLLN